MNTSDAELSSYIPAPFTAYSRWHLPKHPFDSCDPEACFCLDTCVKILPNFKLITSHYTLNTKHRHDSAPSAELSKMPQYNQTVNANNQSLKPGNTW